MIFPRRKEILPFGRKKEGNENCKEIRRKVLSGLGILKKLKKIFHVLTDIRTL